ncbi:MAG: hypothetical protein AAGA68_16085 [Pseudomonadota bacterium]
MSEALRARYLNGWPLYWLIAVPMSACMVFAMAGYDLSSPQDISHMISYSVRWSVPFIYLVVASSALPVLLPSELSRWCLRNRRYIGLVFATAMAWQGLFIFITTTLHTGYYYEEVYALRDELEGTSGYLFLAAMVLTSFRFGRRHLSNTQWKVLHRSGVYFLWAYPFSVYWWNVFYYGNPEPIDYIFYVVGFLAFASRIAAWGKRRATQAQRAGAAEVATLERLVGGALIVLGLLASATGHLWLGPVDNVLLGTPLLESLELWLPFWPFEPFLALISIGLGTWLATGALREPTPALQGKPSGA